MQRVSVIVLAVVAALVHAEDQCAPPQPGEEHTHAKDCCNIEGFIPDALKSSFQKCMEKFPMPPRPSTPPTSPDPTMRNNHACMIECVFTDSKLLTADKKLDKAAVTKMFSSSDKDLGPVMSAAVTKCLASYESGIDSSLECKSGAEDFKKCVGREVFLNCPSSLWTTSSDCTALKTKVTNCPRMPVMFKGPGPRQ